MRMSQIGSVMALRRINEDLARPYCCPAIPPPRKLTFTDPEKRHTYASLSLMGGMTLEVLSEQLGRKDSRITRRHYAHLSPSHKAEAAKRFVPSYSRETITEKLRGQRCRPLGSKGKEI
jgi:integrase